ncbi:MAG: GspH/FimT family pseudopilin [Rubrivivax sp.]|nr:GspH/FimT family pseudopilin [Rubrivivax sp.]
MRLGSPLRASARPVQRRASCGFTLIEMLVAIALVVVLVALGAPSIRELLAVQRLQNVHAALVTDLQLARSEAVRMRQALIFEVDGDANASCYMVRTSISAGAGSCSCLRTPGSACTGAFREVRTVQVARTTGISLTAASSAAAMATFEPDDGSSRPGDLRVDLVSDVRGALRVNVNAAGRVSSCSPDGSMKQVPRC